MSHSRFTDPDLAIDKTARCRKDAIKSYCGTKRKPFYPDEKDASVVVEVLFPEPERARLKFMPDGDYYVVTWLPALPW